MNQGLSFNYQPLFFALALAVLSIVFGVLPLQASAQTVSGTAVQLLPPGANTCTPVAASDFTPYIYSGSLQSFDFTIADTSYVAIAGQVGSIQIPFQYMTRMAAAPGVRYHVDIPSMSTAGGLTIQITLLSATAQQAVCATTLTFSIPSGTAGQAAAPMEPVSSTSNGSGMTTAEPQQQMTQVPPTAAQSVATATATMTPALTSGVMQNAFSNICASAASAYRLWLLLLLAYALIVGVLLWAEFPLSWSWAQTPERIATIILVLLLILLGFWYFSISCRAALWMPLVAFLIAILGLLAAFWNHPRVSQLLLIQESNP